VGADADPAPPISGPAPGPESDSLGIEPWTLGLIGAGVVITGAGIATLILAGNVQNDINAAPTTTPADLDDLEELESKGRFRYRMTYGLLAAGTVTMAAGVTLGILQRRDRRRRHTSAAVVPIRGGVAATFGGSF
jgi:hypothetical protein